MNQDQKNNGKEEAAKTFPIVAIGAMSGGEEALSEFLQHLPSATGMAYVYFQHPEPAIDGQLAGVLSGLTSMPVKNAEEGVTIEPDQVYLLSHDKRLTLDGGKLKKNNTSPDSHTPINSFLTGFAEQHGEKTIGVLLSGSEPDGAIGLKAIRMAGGLTFAQDDSAQYQTMPKAAVAQGAVDLVLSPAQLAKELSRIAHQKDIFYNAINEMNEGLIGDEDEDLKAILQLLLRTSGVDFRGYKMNTIKRRIIRRMMLHKIPYLKEYSTYLKQQNGEPQALYQDMLINVTSFFRDRETIAFLSSELLPRVIKSKTATDPIRVWIPACSTGQEAYSLAMVIIEALGEKAASAPVQIFATDLSATVINKARLGIYTKEEVAGIDSKRINRFFTRVDGYYRIVKSIRDVCVFANHNISKDPPFSRLDIISCCNLLIYLDTPLQKKILATFHYSLNNNGHLILGKSETVGTSAYLFSQADKGIKIYAKKKDATAKGLFDINYRGPERGRIPTQENRSSQKVKADESDLERVVDDLLLKKFTPASVVVNYDLDILQFRGSTGLYLEPSPGKASLNLMKMAKPGLGFELRNVVHKAKGSGGSVKKTGLEIITDEKAHRISVEAVPIKSDAEEEYFLVVFEEMRVPKEDDVNGKIEDKRVKQLEAELTALREDMRSIVEGQEAANEELQSANEEIVSSNEELQSINEELETSKEEIESSNEELITINQELQVRNEQLAEEQEYSQAIFGTIREALLILDKDLRVRSANKAFYKIFDVRQEDTEGRLLYDLGNRQWNIPKLKELLEDIIPHNSQFNGYEVAHHFMGIGEKVMVLNARKIVQREIGHHLVLLAIEDITEHREAQRIISGREAWFRNMADNAPIMIWVTGTNKLCSFVNKTFLEFRGIALEEAIGDTWLIDAHPDDIERCQRIYDDCFDQKKPFELTYRLKHKHNDYRRILTKAKPNFTTEGNFTGFIGSCIELDEKVKEAARE